jgi:hypothetical protein
MKNTIPHRKPINNAGSFRRKNRRLNWSLSEKPNPIITIENKDAVSLVREARNIKNPINPIK